MIVHLRLAFPGPGVAETKWLAETWRATRYFKTEEALDSVLTKAGLEFTAEHRAALIQVLAEYVRAMMKGARFEEEGRTVFRSSGGSIRHEALTDGYNRLVESYCVPRVASHCGMCFVPRGAGCGILKLHK